MKIKEMLTIQKSSQEDQLIKGCKKNSQKAQRALYERYASKMLGTCMRYINDREEAEHIMVGGMVKVFNKIDQFSGDGSFEGWIRRIVVNEALMYLRKNSVMSVDIDTVQEERNVDLSSLEDHLQAEDLMKMVQSLPVGYRTVFNLYAIEGYNHQEIGEQLGISENTSKSQLSRARKMLQGKLSQIEAQTDKNINYEI